MYACCVPFPLCLLSRGIFLWANRLVFSPSAHAHIASAPDGSTRVLDVRAPGIADGRLDNGFDDEGDQDEEPTPQGMLASAAPGADAAEGVPHDVPGAQENSTLPPLAKQLAPRLVTLALLPRSQVQAMLHLDTIKERAKPEAPPTKPAAAPFFLPTTPSLARNPTFATTTALLPGATAPGGAPQSRVTRVGRHQDGGAAARSPLLRAIASGDDAGAIAHISGVSASALDVELRSLTLSSPDPSNLLQDDAHALHVLLNFLTRQLATGCNFELLHATLACVLRIHGDACGANPELRVALRTLRNVAQESWRRIDGRLQHARGVLSFVAGLGHA